MQYFKTPTLLPGRARFAVQQIDRALPDDARPSLAAAIAAALNAVDAQRDAERQWAKQKAAGTRRGNTQVIDREADEILATIAGICRGLALLPEGHAQGDAARGVLATVFPTGVKAVVSAPFEVELNEIEQFLAATAQPPMADWLAALPLDDLVTRLAAIAPDYRAELEADRAIIDWPAVRARIVASRDALETLLAGLRFHVADATVRARLLASLDEQVRRQRAARQGKQHVVDVDPQTGNEVPIEAIADD